MTKVPFPLPTHISQRLALVCVRKPDSFGLFRFATLAWATFTSCEETWTAAPGDGSDAVVKRTGRGLGSEANATATVVS